MTNRAKHNGAKAPQLHKAGVRACLFARVRRNLREEWALWCGGFGHADDGEGFAVAEGNGDGLDDFIAAEFIERDAGERGAHFEAGETSGFGGVFAGFEEKRAEATAGPVGVNEEGADFCGVGFGIEEVRFADGGVVGAEKSFAFAPATAGGDYFFAGRICGFDDEISLIFDELGVEAENRAESAFDLRGSVVARLEDADGRFDQRVENGNVGVGG